MIKNLGGWAVIASRAPVLFAARGGRINTQASGFGSSGAKTSFLARRPFGFGVIPPLAIRFMWANWHAAASTAAPEVLGTAPIAYRQAAMRTFTAFTPVTVGGAVPVVGLGSISSPFTLSDWILPPDLGVTSFPAFGLFEFAGIGDYGASACPVAAGTNRPGGGQHARYAPANEGGISVYSPQGALAYPSGFDSIPTPAPIAVIGLMPSGAQAIIGLATDSMGQQTGDIQGWGPAGGGLFMRAATLLGIPFFNGGVSGQTGAHLVGPNNLGLRDALNPFATAAFCQVGTNDFAAATQPTAAPNGAASVAGNLAAWSGRFKAASSGGFVIVGTIPPRTTAANNTGFTTLADQTPDVNFGAGSMRTDLNALIVANPGAFGADFGFDAGPFCQDAGDPTRWKLDPFTTTLAAAVAVGATSYQLVDAPPADANLCLGAGLSSIDTSGVGSGSGMYAVAGQVTGTGPYTVASQWNDPYSNSAVSWNPAVAHAAGDPVRGRLTADGIHWAANVVKPAARALAPLMAMAARR
ncbi:UNVERIFIED_CONTAM: hypothetical protein Q9R58_07605 [Methylobacteriaceae bacterium AG10]|nr:hypothetical protein [Methylobacteriaceae bacterium AG10]